MADHLQWLLPVTEIWAEDLAEEQGGRVRRAGHVWAPTPSGGL